MLCPEYQFENPDMPTSAEHFLLSENYLKAADYSRMASKKAEKCVSLNEAIFYAEKCVQSLEQLNNDENIQWSLARDYLFYSQILSKTGCNREAKEYLSKAKSIFTDCKADGWVAKLEKSDI